MMSYTPHIKKPRDPKIVAQRLKLLNAEIELIQSVGLLDDGPAYGGQRVANSFENASSFFKTAPVEILGEIFMACIPHWDNHVDYHHGRDDLNTMDRTHAPWVLTQVCSKWRFIALSLPQLWSRIVIRPDLVRSELDIKITLLSLEISLRRSADAPLFVWLQANERTMDRFEESWAAILDALTRHSKQWQDAILALVPAHIRRLVRIKGCIPNLHRLKLKIVPTGYVQDIGMLDAFAQAPVLRHFEVAGNRATIPIIPWSQLIHYAGESTAETEVELLHGMPSLTHALFHSHHISQGTPPTAHYTHRCLQFLSITGNPFVLDALTIPTLRALSVTSAMLLTPVVAFIHRSACTLTSITLELWSRTIKETGIIEIFEATPALTSLSLTDYPQTITENIISCLIFNPSDPEPCLIPQLRKLDIKLYRIDIRQASQLIEMIESRWKVRPSFPANRIHSVRLRIFYNNVETGLAHDVERLREEGLDLYIQEYG